MILSSKPMKAMDNENKKKLWKLVIECLEFILTGLAGFFVGSCVNGF